MTTNKRVFCEDCKHPQKFYLIFKHPPDLWKCKKNIYDVKGTIKATHVSKTVPGKKEFCAIKNPGGYCNDFEPRNK